MFPFIDRIWVAYNERRLGWLGTIVITTLCIMCGVSYIVARAYLVVEAFASISEVPEDVYKTPSWSEFFRTCNNGYNGTRIFYLHDLP
jgi:hypothetical protein